MNALILKNGKVIDCSARMHEKVCKKILKITLAKAIESGICRTHWNPRYNAFAVDCGKRLTVQQLKKVNELIKDVQCFRLIKCINGAYSCKDSYSRIRKVL